MKCYPILECERCCGCLCVECKENEPPVSLADPMGRNLDHVKCSGCQKFSCCERYLY